MAEAIYLTDLGRCLPGEALSTEPTDHTWHVVDYDAGEISGKMIAAQVLVDAPDVALPLQVTGWHAISIGFWAGIYHDSVIKYRLSNEDVFSVVKHQFEFKWDRTEIVETFPRYADLTDVDYIVFGKQKVGRLRAKACVAYVKLEPLSQQQVDEIERDRARTDTRNTISLIDGDGLFIGHSPRTRNELLELVEIYRHSDVEKVLWGVNLGDLTYYQSKVGRFYSTDNGLFATEERKLVAESHEALTREGINPFVAAMEHAHSMGLEFHTYYRLCLADHAHPFNIFSTESFLLKEHPDWRMVAKDGTPLMKASYAFPEVRDFMVSLMAEAMEYDIDGVNLCFVRGPEYFAYEKPVIDDFRKLYGEDPREIPDEDQRLLRLRAGYMTEFLRAVRRAADTHGAKRGKRIQVSAYMEPSDERMLHFGYEGYKWIEEGLLDFILAVGPPRLLDLARDKGCKVYGFGNSAWPSTPTEAHVADTWRAYGSNLDGMSFWDLDGVQFYPEKWKILGRLGHKEELMELALAPTYYPRMKRRRVLSIRGRDFAHTEGKHNPENRPPEMLVPYSGG